jgi:hypothetical protein
VERASSLPGRLSDAAETTQQIDAEAKFREMRDAHDPRLKRKRLQEEAQREHALRSRLRNASLDNDERAAAEADLAAFENEKKARAFGPGWEGAQRAE